MHDIRYNKVHDELVVGNPFAQAILTFRGGANGDEAPIRVIQGPRTKLKMPDTIAVDPIHNELFVPEVPEGGEKYSRILVFPRDAQGDVAPIRVMRGSKGWDLGGTDVDPENDVLVVTGSYTEGEDTQEALLIFNRTDSGDVVPKGAIMGPRTGLSAMRQFEVYRGWIIVSVMASRDDLEPRGAFVGVWSIHDRGNVPPRWRIDATRQNGMLKPRAVAVNPTHQELIVGDMRLNAVLVYAFPEMFR
jgi:hypothetical protein